MINKEPQPIVFPGVQVGILDASLQRYSTLTHADVVRIVHDKVSEMLYAVLRSDEELDISTMSLADFDAFLNRAMCSDEE